MIDEWFNNNAVRIWKEHKNAHPLVPHFYSKIKIDAEILFVGINPSHRDEWLNQVINKNQKLFGNYTDNKLFNWNNGIDIEIKIPLVAYVEEYARNNDKQYFGAISKLANQIGVSNWEHLDLFLVRDKSQENLEKIIELNKVTYDVNAFGKAQIDLFVEVIDLIKPKKIVILNTLASSILMKKLSPNPIYKTNFIYKDTKIFMSGMVSGQRALDKFSKLRLINEIKE